MIGRRGAIAAALLVLCLGTAGVLAWRYATPIGSTVNVGIQPPPPPPDDGKIGYIYVVDGYSYLDGPHWFPATLLFFLVAIVAILIGAALLRGTGLAFRRRSNASAAVTFTGFAVLVGLFGYVVALIGRAWPPSVYSVVLAEPRDSADPYPSLHVTYFDIEPTWVTFSVIGFAAGVGIAAVAWLCGYGFGRTTDSTIA